jgi:nucleoside-diphosphate-sugar epimerase
MNMGNQEKRTVVIAGASGFVGQALCGALSGSFNVIGLSRAAPKSTGDVTWRVWSPR